MSDPDCLMLAVEVGVLRALELAGKRARHTGGRPQRGELWKLDAWEVHTRRRLATTHAQCDRLLTGAWDLLRTVLPDQARVLAAADWYTRELIVTQQPHRAADLRRVLAVACEP
ncbi:hypothetical protein [Nocardia sp. CC201C]|uniref:hypothetical protein n=1 Tax=Nocardia sp. CC201C TaxID=3044575 RepID=UPI0024A9C8B7|nr:hypothetical protein [Nocardia sp. CC201C]